MARRLVDQIVRGIGNGQSSFEIALRPRNLGPMHIRVQMAQSQVTVRIQTETASAARLLAAGEEQLAKGCEAHGLRLAGITTQTTPHQGPASSAQGFLGDQATSQQGQQGQARGGRGDPSSSPLTRRKDTAPEASASVSATTSQLAHRTLVINLIA
jgi:flagellar hook-length control protein FliK